MTFEKRIINRKVPGTRGIDLEVAIHRSDNGVIVVNMPGIDGDIDGFNDKYAKIGNLVQERIGSVVRIGNPYMEPYPASMINNLDFVIKYSLLNSREISGSENPQLYLMGFSAGASAVASIAGDYSQVEKILLMAPSGDAGPVNCSRLRNFRGDVYISVGENDEIVGKEAGRVFYDLATHARSRKLEIIPKCDHQFRGEINGMIMSKAPLWAFNGDQTFPSPEGGLKLY